MKFFLPMIPPTVTYQEKDLHAYLKDGKPKAVLYDSAEVKETRAKLHAYLAPYRPEIRFDGPVRLLVKWCFPRGEHRDGEYKTTKPDTDNLEKMLKDVMTDLHFWRDDAQVASEIIEKFWAEQPGIYISVEPL